jgi:hypothetical protein
MDGKEIEALGKIYVNLGNLPYEYTRVRRTDICGGAKKKGN